MAYKIPGFKASTGMKAFEPLVDGDYVLKCTKVEVKPPKNPSPSDVWSFQFDVVSGPPQADGKPAKGRKYFEFVTIMHEEHPSYRPDQMGVDQLKSMALAMNVTTKGDSLNEESFVGQECSCHITVEIGKNDGKPRNRGRSWQSAE